MRVALVHEFLTQLGGAERVLLNFHELFPEAPVYTLVYDEQKTQGVFANLDIRPSFLQSATKIIRNYKWFLPLMPWATERFDFQDYDLVLSDSSAFAKGVLVKRPTLHVCYCHTPTRYLWESMEEYVANLPYGQLVKFMVKPYLKYFFKPWDYKAAQRPDYFIANSRTVQKRIKKYYGRNSTVIYPPVNTHFFSLESKKENYFLTVSRLESYKKNPLVVEAFNQLGWSLKIAGEGSEFEKLKRAARPNIEFLGRVPEENLPKLYQEAKAFVFPALEDAGIVVLEALSCGTPVIGFCQGGTAEFVRDGENGVLFDRQTADDLIRALQRFSMSSFSPEKLRDSILEYDCGNFRKKILNFIENAHRN
jgi:glycosyltransferase involved in cell wall biosynthesis